MICAVEARLAGVIGKPTLQLGGLQDAVMVAEPGDPGLMAQDCVQVVPTGKTPGEDEVQVSGTLFRTTPPSVLGSELLPITSVRVAVMVSAVPLEVTMLVCPDPGGPTSRLMFSIAQVAKKSSAGEFAPVESV